VTAIVLVVNSTDPRFSKSLQDVVSRFEKAFWGKRARENVLLGMMLDYIELLSSVFS
jgi:hypothetical protein